MRNKDEKIGIHGQHEIKEIEEKKIK